MLEKVQADLNTMKKEGMPTENTVVGIYLCQKRSLRNHKP